MPAPAFVARQPRPQQQPPFLQHPPGFVGNAGEFSELQDFRRRFPMDERAFGYLAESSPAVQRQVFDTFAPKRLDDVDFSAPVVAYAKLCRARAIEHPANVSHHQQSSPVHGGACAGSYGSSFAGVAPPPPRLPPLMVSAPLPVPMLRAHALPNHSISDAHIGDFCRRYPMDARARELLLASPPAAVARVLREFRPRREGEADYSAAVVAFVGVCKRDALGGKGSYPYGSPSGYGAGHVAGCAGSYAVGHPGGPPVQHAGTGYIAGFAPLTGAYAPPKRPRLF